MKFGIFTDIHINNYDSKIDDFENFLISTKKDKLDGFISTGDWCSISVEELSKVWATFRKVYPHLPLYTTMGNHDFWDIENNFLNIEEIVNYQKSIAKMYNVQLMQENIIEFDDFILTGFDGWYNKLNPQATVDYQYIPNAMNKSFEDLKKRERQGLEFVLSIESSKKKICITHFNFHSDPGYESFTANTRHLDFLTNNFDYLIVGHSHKKQDIVINKCRLINVGADYNNAPFNNYEVINFLL